MNLVIDIGNTHAKAAVFQGETLQDSVHCRANSPEKLQSFIETYANSIDACIVSSVGQANMPLQDFLKSCPFSVVVLNAEMKLPFANLYATPHTLGSDRMAAVAGAMTCFPETDVLIVDVGTCVTYDFLDGRGIYRGGNISPGISLRLMSLHEHTARLPLIEKDGDVEEIGTSTEVAMRSGVMLGLQYEVNGYIERFVNQHPQSKVILTGGKKKTMSIKSHLKPYVSIDCHLVEKGLNAILRQNAGKA